MQIYGPFRVSTTQTTGGIQRTGEVSQAAGAGDASKISETSTRGNSPVDQLDLSAAHGANRMESAGPVAGEGIRFDRVAELRRQIADGTYDTPERMDAALDRMLDNWG
ncbi:flagellar biosynthesis anti-sigma factor FlgM [Stieleria varia]|uniref:Anti-sigma-28 factor FlgM C-terminal domain-containing protein n=1 Tax=Stieleria varia TaxID=2528005 RepID=A0A5C6AHK4_9BACT|nr:flagellar biosynthesis anti-sigma factor FlgM [Stieleria varia]TWT98665.1 hypothetical protein Pla52n_51820 [Stieleria varia]